ncbi:MAG: hypothetical protein Fur0044_39190 [Anaerolineae bacterium]
MKQYRTAEQVKKFDIFKIVTFGILVLLLLLAYAFLRSGENPPAVAQTTTEPTVAAAPATSEPVEATSQPAPATAAAEPAATVEPTATEEATTPTEVTAPTLDPLAEVTAGEVTLTGTGEPGSEVEIVVDGQVVGKTTVGSDGKWSFAADLPDPGEYQVGVQSVDVDGKTLAASEAVALTVTASVETSVAAATGTAAEPAATTEATATEEGAAPLEVTAPTLDQPGEVTAGEVTLTGTGEPGSDVEIVVDGKVIGKTTIGRDGTWSFAADLPDAGEHEVSVQSVDADGKVLAASEAVALTVTAAPAAVATEEAAAPAATAEATTTTESTPSTEAAAPTLDQPGQVTAGEVTLTGTGEPGSDVEIVVDGQVVGKTTVGRDGTWSLVADLSRAGDYKISIQSVGADGSALAASEEMSVEVAAAQESEAAAPEEEGGQAYIFQADDWMSKLALKFYSDMTKYPAIVEATNAKAQEDSTFTVITNPDLIEIGQKLWIPAEAP